MPPFVSSEVEKPVPGTGFSTSLETNGGRVWPTVLIGWGLAAIVLLLAGAGAIARLRFPDADDAMRLLQVRDWIAGQSWWDVAQHRLNHGDFPMHWSRLVDLPLAAVLLPLDLAFAPATADRIAMTIVPLLTLLCLIALAAVLTRRMQDQATATMAVLLAPLSVPIVFQMRPLRIDHHGWQIVLALAAVTLLLSSATRRGGARAGLALAALLTVSIEGLPIAAMIAGTAVAAWAWQPGRRDFTLAMVWALFLGVAALHAATRGPAMLVPACDAMAPVWIAVLGVAAAGVSLAVRFARFGLATRLALLGATGLACAAIVLRGAPVCVAGPFATMPPIDYKLWYLNVSEGRPIWEQSANWAIMTVALPIVGLIGTALAWRDAQGEAKTRWAVLIVLSGAAFGIALLINRAGGTANALALPGAATLLLAMLTRARAIRPVVPRVFATAGALLLASPGQAAGIALTLATAFGPSDAARGVANGWTRAPCRDFTDLRALDRLPKGVVFAPIDPAPDLIAMTQHTAVGAGYHRGVRPMALILTAFAGTPDQARRAIAASGADYVAACPGLVEMDLYRHVAPDGFWARLERGERFDWLEPVETGSPALAWRVVTPLPTTPSRP